MGVTDPLGGINTLFPLFGIANQLLAAIALTVVTVVVVKRGLVKWAWIPALPLFWDLIVTLTASWQKIFSADPKVGYWKQHSICAAAQQAGKLCLTAKTPGDMDKIVRNTFIQGTLSVVFASLVVVVFVAGVVVVVRSLQGTSRPLTEDEPVPSRIFAPSGLIPTKSEREVQKQWDELPDKQGGSHARSVGISAN
jgi:carbon starvation protein